MVVISDPRTADTAWQQVSIKGGIALGRHAFPGCNEVLAGEYRVPELDQKQKKAPTTLGKSRGRTRNFVMGVPGSATTLPFSSKVIDMQQGTRTLRQAHSTAPAVAAMAHTSLRLGAFSVFPHKSECGRTSAPRGGEMV